ncbi:MAG: cytochrome c maturation protein CcmE [Pseudomonadota bacterium]
MAATLRKQRRIQLIALGMTLLFAASGAVILAIGEGAQFFRSPTQVFEDPPRDGEVFRLGGLVKEGTRVSEGVEHQFLVTDTNMDVPVSYVGIVPDLFGEGEGTVVTGQLVNGIFVATEVLARHDETYMPKEVTDALKEQGVYRGES